MYGILNLLQSYRNTFLIKDKLTKGEMFQKRFFVV